MSIAPVAPVDLIAQQLVARADVAQAAAQAAAAAKPMSFSQMLMQGVDATNTKLAEADRLIAQAAVDTSIPMHRVTYALEEARISLELMIQVRNRLIDASQQLLNMQI